MPEDLASRRPAGWAVILAVVAVVLLTVVGGYAVVQSSLRPTLDGTQTVRAYVAAQSDADCDQLAALSTADHLASIYCPPSEALDDLGDFTLEVTGVDLRDQSSTTVSLLADVTVTFEPDGSFFTTAVAYTLVREGDRWLVDAGRDPRPLAGSRSVRLGS